MRDELMGSFPDREIKVSRTDATAAEETAYASLVDVSFHDLDGGGQGVGQLFRTTLEKAPLPVLKRTLEQAMLGAECDLTLTTGSVSINQLLPSFG